MLVFILETLMPSVFVVGDSVLQEVCFHCLCPRLEEHGEVVRILQK